MKPLHNADERNVSTQTLSAFTRGFYHEQFNTRRLPLLSLSLSLFLNLVTRVVVQIDNCNPKTRLFQRV